jgi:pyruvate/2-oxoglutarate dehydrogenase complex dihydrolipoamide acyltransferase (E2) component
MSATRKPCAEASAFRTAKVERGDIRVAISATGTLAAISTVDVGSQISGQVTDVLVDFNDRVERGQVIVRIDPSTYQAQIVQGSAAVTSARANLATAQATLRNAEADHARKAQLATQQLVARSEADPRRPRPGQCRASADQPADRLDPDLRPQPGPDRAPLAGRRRAADTHRGAGPDRGRQPAGAGAVPDRRGRPQGSSLCPRWRVWGNDAARNAGRLSSW